MPLDLWKQLSMSTLISITTDQVFTSILVVILKEDMLSRLLDGDLPVDSTIGLLLIPGVPHGEKVVSSESHLVSVELTLLSMVVLLQSPP